jgi:hypothetical protein
MRIQTNPIIVTYINHYTDMCGMVFHLTRTSSQIIKIRFDNVFDVVKHIQHGLLESGSNILKVERHFLIDKSVDDCSYARPSLGHKHEREPLRGVCGSYLRHSWNIEMASFLPRVEKNYR